jgi:dCMP deaminase
VNRISRELAFMQVAEVFSRRSTCMRRNVGCVITVNENIVSIGYNGAPAGQPHCDGETCVVPGEIACSRTVHAEFNAISRVPTVFVKAPKRMFVTESPCIACASRITSGPIKNFTAVYYLNEYRIDTGIRNIIMSGIDVFRMTPSGFIIRKLLDEDRCMTEKLNERSQKPSLP